MKRLPIGLSDYKKLIDDNCYYVDKTLFIEELWRRGGAVTLIPRPRRFGKTLNMSTLKYFFEKSYTQENDPHPHAYLFEDKKIWELAPMRALQGKFPVIFLTFKSVKESSWQSTYEKIINLIAEEYKRHEYLLQSDLLNQEDKKIYQSIISLSASEVSYHMSLLYLSRFLQRYHGVNTIILIDEYDAPIHEAFINGFYDQVTRFMRGFLGDGLKDNASLERGVITGILRTAKEGIFSGLNNLKIFTLLDDEMADKFGFTQQEIDQLLQDYNLTSISQDFKAWYNGYLIGETKIYNPWSSLGCVDKSGSFQLYWVNTSNNALVAKIIATAGAQFKNQCADLLSGKVLEEILIEDKMALPGMLNDDNTIWNMLLFTGYLTIAQCILSPKGRYICSLVLPNREILSLFDDLINDLFKQSLGQSEIVYLEQALRDADGKLFSKLLSRFITQSMSFHDISADEPERSYHLFILGILVTLGHRYAVQSNKESGYGRYDIMLIPLDKSLPEIVIEFKKRDDDETMEECSNRAIEQIKNKAYVAELQGLGFSKIVLFGIACHKKDVLLKQESI